VGYRSAGTVEMLCDEQQNFYFLEMNTRLQVEHPITEAISGQDLVEHMLYIAAGRALPDGLMETGGFLQPKGHAIESRVYAEDPLRNFLPSTGLLLSYKEPKEVVLNSEPSFDDFSFDLASGSLAGLDAAAPKAHPLDAAAEYTRVDSGIVEGFEISMHYDPMISKLITYGETRDDAIKHMNWALANYPIAGLRHNMAFLMDVMKNKTFQGGLTSTDFIPHEYPEGFQTPEFSLLEDFMAAGVTAYMSTRKASKADPSQPLPSGFVMPSDEPESTSVITLNGLKGHPIYTSVKDDLMLSSTVEMLIPGADAMPDDDDITALYGDEHTCTLRLKNITWEHGAVFSCIVSMDVDTLKRLKDADEARVMKFLENTTFQTEGDDVEFKLVAGYGGASDLKTQLYIFGREMDVCSFTPREYEYNSFILKEKEIDVSKILQAPMPGKIISIDVAAGDVVQDGQRVAIMEAMKMQTPLVAPKRTVVKAVNVGVGDTVKVDEVLLTFEDTDDDDDGTNGDVQEAA